MKTDLINWSCTSSYFRNLLAPKSSKAASSRLSSSFFPKSISFLNKIVKCPYNADVKELQFSSSKTPEQVLKAQILAAWRTILFRTYSVAQNKSLHFKHLEIRKLFWKKMFINLFNKKCYRKAKKLLGVTGGLVGQQSSNKHTQTSPAPPTFPPLGQHYIYEAKRGCQMSTHESTSAQLLLSW